MKKPILEYPIKFGIVCGIYPSDKGSGILRTIHLFNRRLYFGFLIPTTAFFFAHAILSPRELNAESIFIGMHILSFYCRYTHLTFKRNDLVEVVSILNSDHLLPQNQNEENIQEKYEHLFR